MRSARKTSALVLVLVLALALVAGGAAWRLDGLAPPEAHAAAASPTAAEGDQKGLLAGFIERSLSTPGMKISIGAVSGALSSDATISDVSIADSRGVWLRLDHARLVWTRSALLLGRLVVDRLDIGRLEILRKPIAAAPAAAPPRRLLPSLPSLPSLPVKVSVGSFSCDDLVLGPDYLGTSADLSAHGHASLGRPSDGLDLSFDLQRKDAPGTLSLSLAYDPAAKRLKLVARVHEPAGGLIAHAANLGGQPPVDLDLSGDGPLDAFEAKIAFAAGSLATVAGDARLDRKGAGRDLTLHIGGDIEHLLPPWLGPVFAGRTRIDGALRFSDGGGYAVDRLSMVATAARLDLYGTIGADQALHGHLALKTIGGRGGRTLAGDAEIGALDLEATASGTLTAPQLQATLHVADARAAAGRIGRLDARLTGAPADKTRDPAMPIALSADVTGQGLAFSDPKWSRLLGDRFSLSLRGRASSKGQVEVEVGQVRTGAGEIDAQGEFGPKRVAGTLRFDAPDLADFAPLSGWRLSGATHGTVTLEGAPDDDRMAAQIDVSTARLTSGIAALDGLLGGAGRLVGRVSRSPDGFVFSGLNLSTAHVSANVDGPVTKGRADLRLVARVDDLSPVGRGLGVELSGGAALTATLGGTLDHPAAVATLAFSHLRSMGRPIPRLSVDVQASDLLGAMRARAAIDGTIGSAKASGALALARLQAGGWQATAEDLRIGSLSLKGRGDWSAAHRLTGHFALRAPDLDQLTPLVLQKLRGSLDAKLDFSASQNRQDLAITAKGAGLRVGRISVASLALDLDAHDLFGAATLGGKASVDRAEAFGQTVRRLRLTATPAGAASDLAVEGDLSGLTLAAHGRLALGGTKHLALRKFEARRGGQKVTLASPADLAFGPDGLSLGQLDLQSGGGRLHLDGKIGDRLALGVRAKAFPLALARLVQPSLDLAGSLDGDARISGPLAAPAGDWRVTVRRLSAARLRESGLAFVDIDAAGRLQGGRTTLDARASLPKGGTVRVQGSAPAAATGALDLSVKAALDASLANVMLADSGRQVAGKVTVDGRIGGDLRRPLLSGAAILTKGAFADPLAGVRLAHIEAALRANGDNLRIERLTATAGGGTLDATGSLRLGPSLPAAIHLQARKALLVSSDIATAVGDLDLDLSGPLASHPRLTGKVGLRSLDIRVPDRLPASNRPLADVVHIDPSPAARARLALEKRNAQRRKAAPPFDADLDVTVDAPSQIFVRGRGIDAELGGRLVLHGDLKRPAAQGAFELRRGQFTLAGQKLNFSQGRISFDGGFVPDLDFVAQTTASDVTAQIDITGPADHPTFQFSSTPQLPQDEVLSRLLFARAAGGLTPVQALMLAQTAAELSGHGGPGVMDKLRRSLGVDRLDVQLGADGSPQVGASRYITRNVDVGVKTGAKPENNGATLGIDLTRHFRLQGEADANGAAAAGVGVHWDY